jgi:twitching motility protein PilT
MDPFQRLLQAAVEHGASDIHLKAGSAPLLRIAREPRAVETAPFIEDQLRQIVGEILPVQSRERFERDHEADFS